MTHSPLTDPRDLRPDAPAPPLRAGGARGPYRLFEAIGVELEYMIVDRETLDVRPVADQLFLAATGEPVNDFDASERVAWSNELALHVVELKTRTPAHTLDGLAEAFQAQVARIDRLLEPLNCRLMPAAMHPWMNPARETRLWPHENNEIYATYDRIFGCSGHGWGNLQSTHINLPFGDDEEFGRLHAAIRPVLALLPALAASSPIADGRDAGYADFRMQVYRHNADRVPSMAGDVIPEPVFTEAAYRERILGRLYADLAPVDPAGVLRDEWANARGAIARFDRGAIEIRVIDVQECPAADLAVVAFTRALVRAHVEERFIDAARQRDLATDALARVLRQTTREGDAALLAEPALLEAFGADRDVPRLARDLLARLVDALAGWSLLEPWAVASLQRRLALGSLSGRLLGAWRSGDPADAESPARLRQVFARLADCLAAGTYFDG